MPLPETSRAPEPEAAPGHARCPNVGSALLSVGSSSQRRDAALTHYKVDRPGRHHGHPGIPVITPSMDITCPPIGGRAK